MTLSWHTGHKANGLLLLAVPAAITRVTLSRSSPDEGPLSDVIRQVGLGRIEPGRGPVRVRDDDCGHLETRPPSGV